MKCFILTWMMLFTILNLSAKDKSRPNVILILTDDQGIGDLGCHGNPWLKTPNIDAFYQQALRMTDFHVSPLCTPSRSAILTGRYPINNGAWATFKGRDALSVNATTMADVFRQAGYKTAMFGKWHLGDNYPVRATDCGFDKVVQHHAGGIGELSDYWGNSYFNDVYHVNNEPQQFKGYCTDVWFNEAIDFITDNNKEPFFVYLPLNAPHDPLIVDEKYSKPYKHLEGKEIVSADLYGMIANIDENFGRFITFLQNMKLEENTILIYMSDNGTRFGYSSDGTLGYNMGYSGIKGSKKEGGHRVPFFIRWPNGMINGGRDIGAVASHVDLLPTLTSLCEIKISDDMQLDGIDLSDALIDNKPIESRHLFIHHRQDWRPPKDVKGSCIIQGNWRLINGELLYNIDKDPRQINNLAQQYPSVVESMLEANTSFISESKDNVEYNELPAVVIGHPAQKEVKLTIQHAIGDDVAIWKASQVAEGVKNQNNTHSIQVHKDGLYEIRCCRWPKECPGLLRGVPDKNPKGIYNYRSINPDKVRISIANQILEKEIHPDDEAIVFKLHLQSGKTLLVNDFIDGEEHYGVYYTYIKLLKE